MAASRKTKVVFKRDAVVSRTYEIFIDDGEMSWPVGYCCRDWRGWRSEPIKNVKFQNYKVLYCHDRTLNGLKRKVREAIAQGLMTNRGA